MSKHDETHSNSSETIRDVVIGMSDGLTVPFALAAGVSGAAAGSGIIITAGAAEIAAGAIAMGLGGYLAARTDVDHYRKEYNREMEETATIPQEERAEVATALQSFGMSGKTLDDAVASICANRTTWVEFMMKYELGLDEPDEKRAPRSAGTIAVSYIVGGIVPLAPYVIDRDPQRALIESCIVTLIALFVFGGVKGRLTGMAVWPSALQSTVIGGIAAGAAFGLARLIGHAST